MNSARLLTLSLLAMVACAREVAPPFQQEVTQVSVPKEGLPFFSGPDMNPIWPTGNPGAAVRRMPKFQLTSATGGTVTEAHMQGKILVVSFFYSTCRGICPALVANLRGLLRPVQASSDVLMVSFSIDPESDSPEKITAFLKAHKVLSDRWLFLTGDKAQIHSLARSTFNADTIVPSGTTDFVHSENVYLMDSSHYLRAIYRGRGPASLPRILEDIGKLRREQGGSRQATRL